MTIAAISTAPGRAGVAVVRVSGPDAFAIVRALTGREARPGKISMRMVCGENCVVLAFKGPRSYTGEDVAEFQCHGGFIAPQRILEACFAAGARLARRGEFTQRAFLNGKIGLEAAEAVIDLIDAKTVRAAENALAGLAEANKAKMRALYDAALDISCTLEHALDISEEELPQDFMPGVASRISAFLAAAADVRRSLGEGRLLRRGALVAILGKPNAGKSSLMNALLGQNRAIVSDVAGTTRDSIEEWLDIEGWPVRLADTAGLRATADVIEAEGVERAKSLAAKADIVIALDDEAAAIAHDGRTIRVHAKCDLSRSDDGALNISSVTHEGLDDLRSRIAASLNDLANLASDDDAQLHDERASAIASAVKWAQAAAGESDIVLAANSMHNAAESLAPVVDAHYSADMLERLFSRFCVGK